MVLISNDRPDFGAPQTAQLLSASPPMRARLCLFSPPFVLVRPPRQDKRRLEAKKDDT